MIYCEDKRTRKNNRNIFNLTSESRVLLDGRKFPDTPKPIIVSENFGFVKVMNTNRRHPMESKESIELKAQTKEKLRQSLIDNGSFETDIIDEILMVFDITAAEYEFIKKKVRGAI